VTNNNHYIDLPEATTEQALVSMKSTDMDDLLKWIKGMDEEHTRFLFDKVWTAVLKENYKDVMPITMTWALKLKVSKVQHEEFQQIPNMHYDPNSKSSL
jgi:hypothetical protein